MSRRRLGLILIVPILLLLSDMASSQGTTNGTLRGRVINEGQGLPGVSVTIKSPALQGERTRVTSANGDYVFVGLPPGDYTVTFTLQAFRTMTQTIAVTTAQEAKLETPMSLAGVEAAATVVARTETISTSGPQASQTFTKELTDKLPITRTILSSVTLAAGVNTNGPGSSDRIGNGVSPVVTISGGQSFDNLFTVDGAVITDNIRGTPNNLFVEDAIAETTTSTSGVSAEFGRFTGGVVNTVTKSGGNQFSGSFRTTLTNAAWSATTPLNEATPESVDPRYEATLGGPLWKDHVWFFGSGRAFDQNAAGQTRFTNISYTIGDNEKRYQGKLTLTPVANHTVTGSYLHVDEEQTNSSFGTILDLASLVPARQLPQEIVTVNYNGVLTNNFFVEGLYAKRKFTFQNAGSPYTDLINGTLMRDLSRVTAGSSARYNAPTFCGVCDPEKRDNEDFLVKGTYFLSTPSLGSHNIVAGYDHFAGKIFSNNYQSGSNYRLFTTATILANNDIFPVIDGNSYVYYTPILNLAQTTNVVTHSAFLNDSWRLSERLSFNLGVRWDKNHAADSRGVVTADDSAFSPRVAATFDAKGDGRVKLNASYARYVGAIQDSLVGGASDGGNPATFIWYYEGPNINVSPPAGAPLVTRAQALRQVFDWFFAQGCPDLSTCKLPLAYADVPGVNRSIPTSLKSPHTDEYVVGFAGTLGASFSYRMDAVRREFKDFYNLEINSSTGTVTDVTGRRYDLGIINNTNAFKRNYTGLHTSLAYRNKGFSGGVNWTWSHTLGNIDGENAGSGPITAASTYPEYKQPVWNTPTGDLATDQRHRVRLFAAYDLPFIPQSIGTLNISGVQAYDTGVPYGAFGPIDTRPYVTNPGYVQAPTSVSYYFTGRDAFRTNSIKRTDLALNFSTRIGGLVEIFVQPQVLNVFNNHGLLGVDASVQTARNTAGLQRFDPFSQAPVQGVNWNLASTFGTARSANDYQLPRTFTLAAGLRF